MAKKKLISIVIPVLNEEEVIPELIKRLKKLFNNVPKYNFEVIFVEHGSTDSSFKLLRQAYNKNKKFKVLQLSRNFTCDGGIASGLQYASGDACVIMMADLQEPPELIHEFIKKWETGYKIVYGVVRKRPDKLWKNIGSRIFYKIINLFTNNMFPENASDFRLVDKKVYQVINQMKEKNKYLRGLVMWTGFKHTGVLFDREKRFAGQSKAKLRTVSRLALNGIISFSYLPLRLVTLVGVIMSLFSFFTLMVFIYLYITLGRTVPGHMSLITILLFLFGTLFLIIGLIGEYLARIYDEVKDRPNFIVKDMLGLK